MPPALRLNKLNYALRVWVLDFGSNFAGTRSFCYSSTRQVPICGTNKIQPYSRSKKERTKNNKNLLAENKIGRADFSSDVVEKSNCETRER
ncbi:hypothetical protein CEXT_596921 [Caerostris extrusa]|uniref:Uncharacterized protein n=1 Tax=Caerostris extrusa TaxID=172846 RepID=A0AAV4TF18_CAEEX|nr:hypothetical protein CEXT_596921 [Caerostris extrusa]